MGARTISAAEAKAIRDTLATVLDQEHIDGLISHRNLKRAPLTMLAVRGLMKKWAEHPGGPNDAVEIMATRGWTGFDVAWLAGQQRGMPAPRAGSREARKTELRNQVNQGFDFHPMPRRLQ